MIPLTALVPLQLSIGAVGDLAVGYDSTAVNPRTGRYVDAALLRPAIDVQLLHRTDAVRHYLRNRAEGYWESTGGRSVTDSDFFNVTRYGLIWEPSESLTVHTDASYAVGAPTFFFSRAGRPDVSFAQSGLAYPRQWVADYLVRQDFVYRFTEADALQVEGVVAGRYRIVPQPRGQNMFTPSVGARWTHDFSETDNGHLVVRGEYLDLELFRPVWLGQSYVGWGHAFETGTTTMVEAGGTLVQSNIGDDRLDAQPFFRGRATHLFERERIMIGGTYTHTFGVVSATLGTGALDNFTAAAYWRPSIERLVFFGDATFQRGEGYDPTAQVPAVSTIAGGGLGARWRAHEHVNLYARYFFQWENNDALRASGQPEFVRHIAMVGAQFIWGTDEDATAMMVPVEEIQAMEFARGFDRAGGSGLTRTEAPAATERERRRRRRLPGDPPDDEREREERERERWQQTPGARTPGDDTRLPGESEQADPTDPFRDTEREDEAP